MKLKIRATFSAKYMTATDEQMRKFDEKHDPRIHMDYSMEGNLPFEGYRTVFIWKTETIRMMLMAEFYKRVRTNVDKEVHNLEVEIKEWDALPTLRRIRDKSNRILNIKKIVRKDLLNRLANARFRQIKVAKFSNTRQYKVVKGFFDDKSLEFKNK